MKRYLLCLIFVVGLVLGVGACVHEKVIPVTAAALYFSEQEAGGEPTRTRMLITPEFLRIDDGTKNNDFLLFDRKVRTIYSVSRQDKTVLVIASQLSIRPLRELTHRVERDNERPPSIGGKPVKHYRLWTNGQLCYDLYAAEGLLPEAQAALREYRESLAREQETMLKVTPDELQTPCDLANNIYIPARYLDHGFPVRLKEYTGRSPGNVRTTELVDYRTNFQTNAVLFQLPSSYRQLRIQDLRER